MATVDGGVGSEIDSYYEYLFKAYVLLGDSEYLDMFNTVIFPLKPSITMLLSSMQRGEPFTLMFFFPFRFFLFLYPALSRPPVSRCIGCVLACTSGSEGRRGSSSRSASGALRHCQAIPRFHSRGVFLILRRPSGLTILRRKFIPIFGPSL